MKFVHFVNNLRVTLFAGHTIWWWCFLSEYIISTGGASKMHEFSLQLLGESSWNFVSHIFTTRTIRILKYGGKILDAFLHHTFLLAYIFFPNIGMDLQNFRSLFMPNVASLFARSILSNRLKWSSRPSQDGQGCPTFFFIAIQFLPFTFISLQPLHARITHINVDAQGKVCLDILKV